MPTPNEIRGWLARAQKGGARYLIVGRDNFDNENYPIYVLPEDDVWDIIDHLGDNGTGRMGDSYDEVYDLKMDIETQMAEWRAIHLPPRTVPYTPVKIDEGRATRESRRMHRLFERGFYG